MTPKEKAQELLDKFLPHVRWKMGQEDVIERAKQCALIAVDEVLKILPQSEYLEDRDEYYENRERLYWKEVKQEIEKYHPVDTNEMIDHIGDSNGMVSDSKGGELETFKDQAMKQTAVELLIKQINSDEYQKAFGQTYISVELIAQALAMEKEQIIDAFGVGCHLESKRLIGYHDIAEQYYNETYGSVR